MNPADIVAALRAVDALLALLGNAGVAVQKIQAMRDANASGHLTDEQIGQLAGSAHDALAQLGPR